MTATLQSPVRVTQPGDLLASVPHLLGFHPEDSLVVLAMRDTRLDITLRLDLPMPRHRGDVADQLLFPLSEHRPTTVVLLVFGGGEAELPEELPHAGLIDAVDEALESIQVPVSHAVWVERSSAGARWFCYDDVDCTGTVSNPATTALGVATASRGMVTFASRADLAAVVAPTLTTSSSAAPRCSTRRWRTPSRAVRESARSPRPWLPSRSAPRRCRTRRSST